MGDDKNTIDDLICADPELIDSFITEAKEHLDSIEDDFLTLEKQKHNPDRTLLDKVFRAIHSVKGAAGFLGLGNMTQLAHAMETMLSRMREGEIRPETECIDALLAGVDLLTNMLEDIKHCNQVDVTRVHDHLCGLLEQAPVPEAKEDATPLPQEFDERQSSETDGPIDKESGAVARDEEAETVSVDTSGMDFGSTIRIHLEILDKLMVLAGELVLVRNQLLASVDDSDPVSRAVSQRLDKVTSELQETVIRTRMQPLGKIFGKFPRIVRDLGKKLGKDIEISISGSEAELDRTILEALADPMAHIIRNCCDHGIEDQEARILAGKPKRGHITLAAYHEEGRVNIEIRDDGRGIDPEVIRRKALERGLKTEAELEQMSDKEILHLILLPGFSTAEETSDISGRGVGMDVVQTSIEKLGGTLELESGLGDGTAIHLRLPLTLAILPCLIITEGENRFAIPQSSLVELVLLHNEDRKTKIECADDQELYRYREHLLPMVRLSEVLARPTPFTREVRAEITEKYCAERGRDDVDQVRSLHFAVLKVGDNRFGLIFDQILGTEEIVVKPMHWAVKSLRIYSGATIMGDGKGALILDAESIARHAGIMVPGRTDRFAEQIDGFTKDEELQTVLLFSSGEKEQFAMALSLIRRIEAISMSDIERIGEKEYITIGGTSTRVLRLDHVLNVSPVVEQKEMSLILPRHRRPVGILISSLLDTEETAIELNVESHMEDGLLGTGIVRDSMTLFIDIYRLMEKIEPEWFGNRRKQLSSSEGNPQESAKHVLLLEDDSFFRHLVKGYLEAEGYTVVTAENGRMGLDCMEENEFDLVVADLEMPIMNGWEFLKNLRGGTYQNDVPAMALTSLDSDKDRERARECGFDRYQVKLNRETFLSTVEELLSL